MANELDKIKDYLVKIQDYDKACRVRSLETNEGLSYAEKVGLARNIVFEEPEDEENPVVSLVGKTFIVPEEKKTVIEFHRKKASTLREESRKLIEEACENDKMAWDLIRASINKDGIEDLGLGLNYNSETLVVTIIKDKE